MASVIIGMVRRAGALSSVEGHRTWQPTTTSVAAISSDRRLTEDHNRTTSAGVGRRWEAEGRERARQPART